MRQVLLLVLLCSAAPLLAQATDPHAADRAYIRQAESDWAESVATHDCSAPQRIMAEDFVGVDVDGSHYTKADSVNYCRTKPTKFASNHLGDLQVHFFGDVAIAQGDENWVLKTGQRGKFVWTDTWLKRHGRWQVVAAEDLIPAPNPFTQ